MSWQMKLYIAVNVIAVAYCAVLAWEIVKELREGRASSRPRPGQSRALPSRPGQSRALPSRPRPGQSRALPPRLALASLLFLSGALEVAR